jgi:hypothetical protein
MIDLDYLDALADPESLDDVLRDLGLSPSGEDGQ